MEAKYTGMLEPKEEHWSMTTDLFPSIRWNETFPLKLWPCLPKIVVPISQCLLLSTATSKLLQLIPALHLIWQTISETSSLVTNDILTFQLLVSAALMPPFVVPFAEAYKTTTMRSILSKSKMHSTFQASRIDCYHHNILLKSINEVSTNNRWEVHYLALGSQQIQTYRTVHHK